MKIHKLTCPYCSGEVTLVSGAEVYPNREDLADKPIYACLPCQAWVGCHPGTYEPLGRLADKNLRYWKMKAHTAFDPLWRHGKISRSKAYEFLSLVTNIPKESCHIGMFDEEQCQLVLSSVTKLKQLIQEHYDDNQSQRLNRARNDSLISQSQRDYFTT